MQNPTRREYADERNPTAASSLRDDVVNLCFEKLKHGNYQYIENAIREAAREVLHRNGYPENQSFNQATVEMMARKELKKSQFTDQYGFPLQWY